MRKSYGKRDCIGCLKKLEEIAKQKTSHLSKQEAMIRGLFSFDLLFKPDPEERTFSYTVITAECLAQGSCYTYEDVKLNKELMGKDARQVKPKYRSVKIALLDALYGGIERQISETYYLNGSAKEKATPRAEIVCKEVARLLDSLENRKVVNVGVVGEFIPCLLRKKGMKVYCTDMDPQLVGTTIHGIEDYNALVLMGFLALNLDIQWKSFTNWFNCPSLSSALVFSHTVSLSTHHNIHIGISQD